MYFSITPDKKKIYVNDGVNQFYMKGQQEADIVELNDNRAVFRWQLDADDVNNNKVRMRYRATYWFDTQRMNLLAQQRNGADDFAGTAGCTIR